jgi:hypothetical protein
MRRRQCANFFYGLDSPPHPCCSPFSSNTPLQHYLPEYASSSDLARATAFMLFRTCAQGEHCCWMLREKPLVRPGVRSLLTLNFYFMCIARIAAAFPSVALGMSLGDDLQDSSVCGR